MTSVERAVSFDAALLEDAEREAGEEFGGDLDAFVSAAVSHRVKVRAGRRLMLDDQRELGPVPADVARQVEAEWPA